jgi:ribosomal-protein-alanine N-acetyltransferase
VGELPVLETDRLRLRPFAVDLSDLDAMVPVLSDPYSMRFYPKPLDRAGVRAWIQRQLDRYQVDGFGLCAIEERMTDEVLGDCGPTIQDVDGQAFVELGWHVRPDRQREGIATEAGAAWRDHCHGSAGVARLISLIRPENVGSERVARKLGFRPWRETVRAGMLHVVWSHDA